MALGVRVIGFWFFRRGCFFGISFLDRDSLKVLFHRLFCYVLVASTDQSAAPASLIMSSWEPKFHINVHALKKVRYRRFAFF
jgi:hypothetical protein